MKQERSVSTYFQFIVLLLIAGWAAFNWIATVVLITKLYVTIPVADYWRVVEDLAKIKALDPTLLWRQHNEHRIVFEEIVFSLDMLVFHGQTIFPIICSFVCYFGTWTLWAYLIASESTMPAFNKALAIAFSGVITGWKGSALVLADAFLLQWTLTGLAVMLCFLLLTRVKNGRSLPSMAGIIVCGTVATYSSGNGLLLWPVLIAAGYLAGLTRKQLGVLAVSWVVVDGLYFLGYKFQHNTDILKLVSHPVYTVGFVAAYLSMPFGAMKSPRLAVYIGVVNLLLFLFLFCVAGHRRLLTTPVGIVLFGWFCFTIVTALLTASGRMDLQDASFAAAKPVRYLTPILVNWAALVTLLFWVSGDLRSRPLVTRAIGMALAGLLLFSFPKLGGWIHAGEQPFIDAQTTELSIEDGLRDPDVMRSIFPDYHFVEYYLPQLRKWRLSIYYDDREKWLGRPLSSFAPVLSSPMIGSVAKTTAKQSGYEALGWADTSGRPSFDTVTLANNAGQIIGFGRRNSLGLPFGIAPLAQPAKFTWIAYVSSRFANLPFSAYILDPKTRSLKPIPGEYKFK